jgi:hypothetical protein
MNRYAHHCRPQYAPMKHISRLKYLQDRAVVMLGCFRAIHGLVHMRIERHAHGINAFRSQLGDVVYQLLVNQFEAFAIIRVLRLAMRSQRRIKASITRAVDRRESSERSFSTRLR